MLGTLVTPAGASYEEQKSENNNDDDDNDGSGSASASQWCGDEFADLLLSVRGTSRNAM
jgi:hypothetical protein